MCVGDGVVDGDHVGIGENPRMNGGGVLERKGRRLASQTSPIEPTIEKK